MRAALRPAGREQEEERQAPLRGPASSLLSAKEIAVPAPRVYDIARGKRAISADTALRLARYFGTSPEFWLNLQGHYYLELEEDRSGERIEKEVRPRELV